MSCLCTLCTPEAVPQSAGWEAPDYLIPEEGGKTCVYPDGSWIKHTKLDASWDQRDD